MLRSHNMANYAVQNVTTYGKSGPPVPPKPVCNSASITSAKRAMTSENNPVSHSVPELQDLPQESGSRKILSKTALG